MPALRARWRGPVDRRSAEWASPHDPGGPVTKENLLNLTPDAAAARLREFFTGLGEPEYRAAQTARRLWLNPARDFASMTELPQRLREQLDATFVLPRLEVVARQRSS